MEVITKQRGETPWITAEFKNLAGAYADPTTSIKISIWDTAGILKVTSANMSKDADGKFHYGGYTIPADGEQKLWTYRVEAISGTYIDYEFGYFLVE